MLNVGLNCDKEGLDVQLAEEIIQYHTQRSAGIDIVVTILLKSTTEEEKYLGVWHRTQVSGLSIVPIESWIDPKDLHNHIFTKIVSGRASVEKKDRTLKVRMFINEDGNPFMTPESQTGITIAYTGNHENAISISFPIESKLGKMRIPEPELRPYTYAEIGPFSGIDRYYAVRIKMHLDEDTVLKLCIENHREGTRYYEVYGTEHILYKIRNEDIPDLAWATKSKRKGNKESKEVYEDRFCRSIDGKKITPEFYSVVVLDSPDSGQFPPHRLIQVPLEGGTRDLTNCIDEKLFKKNTPLHGFKDRIFWHVSLYKNQKFRLRFKGPIGDPDRIRTLDTLFGRRYIG